MAYNFKEIGGISEDLPDYSDSKPLCTHKSNKMMVGFVSHSRFASLFFASYLKIKDYCCLNNWFKRKKADKWVSLGCTIGDKWVTVVDGVKFEFNVIMYKNV